MIIEADYTLFNNQNICLALDETSSIHFINLDSLKIVYVLEPTIIMGDKALAFIFNHNFTHLLQYTEGGYIIFWKMESILDELLKRNKAITFK